VNAGFRVTHYPTDQSDVAYNEIIENCPRGVDYVLGEKRPSVTKFIEDSVGMYDGILISRAANMRVVHDHFHGNCDVYRGLVLVYDAEAVLTPREMALRELNGEFVSASLVKDTLDYEVSLSDIADATLAVSSKDANYFKEARRTNVRVLSHSLDDTPTDNNFEQRVDFLFVGRVSESASPNVDSLLWFVEHVMPRLDQLCGSHYRLVVAGKAKATNLEGLDSQRVTFLGQVPDLTEVYNNARVFIAPTRYAAGIPHKVCEAAAFGIPAVITPILADQLGWGAGSTLVASDPADFAACCHRLYSEPALWKDVRQAALREVRQNYSPIRFKAELLTSLASAGLLGAPKPGSLIG
jgi:O-antigen biosynthesis protein